VAFVDSAGLGKRGEQKNSHVKLVEGVVTTRQRRARMAAQQVVVMDYFLCL